MMTYPAETVIILRIYIWTVCSIFILGTTLCYNIEVKKVGIARGPEGSQFGYTVAIVRAPGWPESSAEFFEKELLVGAPNVAYNNIEGHGQIFGCTRPTEQNIVCDWLNITDTSHLCDKLSRKTDTDCAMKGRLGATMEVNRRYPEVRMNTDTHMVTVCAPGWKNVYPETDALRYQNYMIGMCLRLMDNLKPSECQRNSENTCWPFWPDASTTADNGRPVFTYAQAGLSAAFTLDGRSEIIAAPGVDDWRGAYSAVRKKWLMRLEDSDAKTIYLGYALTVGKFGSNFENIVSGTPNWNSPPKEGHYGKVDLFLETEPTTSIKYGKSNSCPGQSSIYLGDIIKIDQMGTKFGAAVEAVDLTGDGLDELLVGAPLYTGDRPEEGRVFVYTSSEQSRSNMVTMCGPIGVLSGGASVTSLQDKTSFSRFGSAIVSTGDLDQDGYNDVAIGAPYEDDGTGAVYIYQGIGECGCKMEDIFVQRIAGKDVDAGIRAFGWSIYGNEDIDDNSFTDLAVGAYETNTVVVLRTRPIVDIEVEIAMSPNPIPLNGSLISCSKDNITLCFEVTVTFMFNPIGTRNGNVNDITLAWSLDSDTVHKNQEGWSRVEFRGSEGQGTLTDNITLSSISNRMYTTKYIIDVKGYRGKPEPKDAWTKVRMEGSYELIPTSGDNFAVLDPIIHKNAKRQIVEYIEFDKKCDSISTCTSNLKLAVEMFLIKDGVTPTTVDKDTVIYVDSVNVLEITADVTNLLNSSYRANLSGEVTTPMQKAASPNNGVVGASCKGESQHQTSTNISCTADSKLDRNENMRIKMNFDISRQRLVPSMNMNMMKEYIHIFFKADQANKDVNEDNNIFEKKIGVKLKYEIRIEEDNDKSEQIRYKADATSTRMITLIHRFYIINDGPSFLPKTYINITVPLSKGEIEVAVIKNLPELCKIRGEAPLVQTTTPGTTMERTTGYSVQPETEFERRKREAAQEPRTAKSTGDNTRETPNSKNITCEEYTCTTIECELLNLEKSKTEKDKFIDITIEVYEKELAKEKEVRTFQYTTIATVTDPFLWYGGKVVPWDRTVYAEKWTTFVVETSSVVSEVNIWIIIGSVLGALVLLIFVIIILRRCGFFARKKHGQVQQWKRDTLYNRKSVRLSTNDKPPYNAMEEKEIN